MRKITHIRKTSLPTSGNSKYCYYYTFDGTSYYIGSDNNEIELPDDAIEIESPIPMNTVITIYLDSNGNHWLRFPDGDLKFIAKRKEVQGEGKG